MCTNYRPGARDIVSALTGTPVAFDYRDEAYPGYAAPIVLLDAQGQRDCVPARFGLVPHWAPDTAIGRRTYNARSETVADKPSYRQAWRRGQFCLVPMQWFYEPNYESGRAVRWRIGRSDESAFCVAGIWDRWIDRTTGEVIVSFSLLTVNADGHPVMGRMHRPEDEKRSIVPLAPAHFDLWLSASGHNLVQAPAADAWTTQAAPTQPVHAQLAF